MKQASIIKLDRHFVNLSLDNGESLSNNHIPKAGSEHKCLQQNVVKDFFFLWIDYIINIRFIRAAWGPKTVCII